MEQPEEWYQDDDEAPRPSTSLRPAKRARVAVACQRCKSRKQRCDGRNPCSNCDAFAAQCQYQPSKFRVTNYNQQQSFKAMQRRLAELEAIVERQGGNSRLTPEPPSPHGNSRSDAGEGQSPGQTSVPYSIASAVEERSGAGQNAMLLMLRDLSIGAMGEYMGATSQVTMSRLISSMARVRDGKASQAASDTDGSISGGASSSTSGWEHLSPKSANTAPRSQVAAENEARLGDIPSNIADKLFRGYIHHISTRWPVMHTPYLVQLHRTRASLCDVYEITVLRIVYAIGGRFLETAGETGDFRSEQLCEQAIGRLDEVIQHHAGLRSIQILMPLALYNLRSPKGPGAWTFVGLAMRQCIDLGLHRQTRVKWPLIEEMRRRVFWSCYCLDRQVFIILGRPFAISDRDIDAELPTDVDEAIEDPDHLRQLQQRQRELPDGRPRTVSTSMTGFIYMCQLRMIESDIQQTIYRVDKPPPSTIKVEVEGFIARLEEWRAQMPLDARKLPNFDIMCVDGYDNYMVYYYKCMRFLLFPVILSSDMADVSFLQRCAEACAGVCRTYKKLHQDVPVGFSVMALHSIFVAGLTLLYCTWAAPREVFSIATSNGLNACSIVMYVIAERWTGARKYRDVFDVVKQAVLETIETGGDEPRRAIANLRQEVMAALKMAGSNGDEVCKGEFSALVNDMAGSQAADGDGEAAHHSVMGDDGDIALGTPDMAYGADQAGPDAAALVDGYSFVMPFEAMPMDGLPFGLGTAIEPMDIGPLGLPPARWDITGSRDLSYGERLE